MVAFHFLFCKPSVFLLSSIVIFLFRAWDPGYFFFFLENNPSMAEVHPQPTHYSFENKKSHSLFAISV